MKSFKILTVVALIALLTFSFSILALTAEETFTYTSEAQKLNDLGLYRGISTETFDPDLGSVLNRETGVVMLLRIFGLEAEADAITDADATLAKFTDASTISSWAKNAVAYAITNGLVQGNPDGTFGPKVALNGKAYCTMILRQLGFTPDYNNAPAELADKGGLTPDEATLFAGKELIKDDLVGMSFGTLSAIDIDGKKVIDNLVVAQKVVDEIAAVDAGLIVPGSISPDTAALDIKAVKAIASKTVEVILNTPPSGLDLAAKNLTASDSEGKEMNISSVSFASWASDNNNILVTFDNSFIPGELYTITSGDVSVKFSGITIDALPKVLSIKPIDYNEVRVDFDRAVKFENTSFNIFQKYGSKSELTLLNISYMNSNTITLSTEDQSSNYLYEVAVYGISDFNGNILEAGTIGHFVGIGRNTDALKLELAFSKEPDTVMLKFNVKVDRNSINKTLFKVEESYGTRKIMTVLGARPASEGDLDETGTPLSFDAAKKYVILTVSELKKVLYKVSATSLKSIYGNGMSLIEGDNYKVFVGMEKPVGPFAFTVRGGIASSYNTVVVDYQNRIDKEIAEAVLRYAITEAYGSKAALSISKVEFMDTTGKSVVLTTNPMKNVLYKLNISNVKDIYGNQLLTSDGTNTITFVGKSILAPIKSISSVQAISSNSVTVEFDQLIGTNATDISNYFISGGIGYPYKVTKIGDKQVLLDLTGTMSGIVYTLTVNGISNSDGIHMDPAGLSKAFYGYYIAPVDPPSPPNPPPAEQCTVQASQQNGQDLALSETNLNGAVIRLTLTNDKFHSWLETQSFELINAPTGTSISGISWIDDTHADVYLIFDGTDFDSDINDFTITIKPQGLYNSEGATTTSILITAVVEDNNGSNVAA